MKFEKTQEIPEPDENSARNMSDFSLRTGESKNPGIVTIKKLCDAFEITLADFFNTPEFDALEQEIR